MSEPQATIHLTCPDERTLEQFHNSQLPSEVDVNVAQHVEECSNCLKVLEKLRGGLASGLDLALALQSAEQHDTPPSLDGYETLKWLGAGGMGVVWCVRDRKFGRALALKVMKMQYCGMADLERRFLAEAHICGRLTHPFIVPVYALGRLEDDRPFYLMKRLEGQSLDALLQARTTPADRRMEWVQIFAQVCQAVGYAHGEGVIHRDLKPGNIMVGQYGAVHVMDWGLAKVLFDADSVPFNIGHSVEEAVKARWSNAPGHTQAGFLLGTLAYMAPEQACGRVGDVDRRSDVFGLGAILCEILTGFPPYTAPELGSLQLQAETADLHVAREKLSQCGADPELIHLAMQCLTPDQGDRPPNAGTVAAAMAKSLTRLADLSQRQREATDWPGEAQPGEQRRHCWMGLAGKMVVQPQFMQGGGAAPRVVKNEWQTAEHALAYLQRADLIPHRSAGEAVVLEVLSPRANRVLDLGTGDGRLLALVLLARPAAQAIALDFSPPMLWQLRQRFATDPRVTVLEHDLEAVLPALGTFDTVVSSFAIHHLSHDRKRVLYEEVWKLLEPGGVFANLEHVSSPTVRIHQEFLDAMGITPQDEDPSNQLLDVETQLGWLREIGFVDVDCYWKWRELALLVGRKPPSHIPS